VRLKRVVLGIFQRGENASDCALSQNRSLTLNAYQIVAVQTEGPMTAKEEAPLFVSTVRGGPDRPIFHLFKRPPPEAKKSFRHRLAHDANVTDRTIVPHHDGWEDGFPKRISPYRPLGDSGR